MMSDAHDKIKVLIIDNTSGYTEKLYDYLRDSGFVLFCVTALDEGFDVLSRNHIDILVLDVCQMGVCGKNIMKKVREIHNKVDVIVKSPHGDVDTFIQSERTVGFDFLVRTLRNKDFHSVSEQKEKYIDFQRHELWKEGTYSLISKDMAKIIGRHFIGKSRKIFEIFELAKTAARYQDINVLITGESGTGKENIARIIHYASLRSANCFYAVNSSSICESLMESEFYGHKKGAFTGAISDKKGYLEMCQHGTLFLDEIADMPLSIQAKLLRAIEEKVITRVGDTRLIQSDFRVISATNHDLSCMIEEKKFRLDLFHRLNTIHIHIPPLRERPEDIAPLLMSFLEDISRRLNKVVHSVDNEVYELLNKYDFPGNVRELKNLAERAVILTQGNRLSVKDFPFLSFHRKTIVHPHVMDLKKNELILIRQALVHCEYNQSAAAETLGISRDALIRKMRKYNITVSRTSDV